MDDIVEPSVRSFDMSKLLRFLESDSMRAISQGLTLKAFKINCYLEETYCFTPFTTEGTSCLAAILTALVKKDFEVLRLCVWTLATFKTTLLEDADGEPCSFVQKLGDRAQISPSDVKTYETDPALEEWAMKASIDPGFEVFTFALAMFVLGFPKRKPISRGNLLRNGKWKHSLASISSFKRPLPRKIKINFLTECLLTDSLKKKACGACLFLEGTVMGRKLREPMVFGIVRPLCDNHTLARQRFQEFKKLYPEAFFKESRFSELPCVSEGMKLLERLEKVMAEAKKAKAELQPLMIRSIDRGYLPFVGDRQMKLFQAYLFFCICNRKGRRGRENWQAYLQAGENRPGLPHLGLYESWVSSLRVQ